MAWLRIDDRVRTHPKIAEAGPAAAWLWFCGICYCREHLTDGAIPRSVVSSLAMNLSQPAKHAARLVAVGLWHDTPNGYSVHDFLDWNPSRADAMKALEDDRRRKGKERGTSERIPEGQRGDASRDRADAPARAQSSPAFSSEPEIEVVAQFLDGYRERYQRVVGGSLPLGSSPKDIALAAQLLKTWKLERLLDMAEIFFYRNDSQVAGMPKTLPFFVPLAPWCDTQLVGAGR